MKAFLGRTQLPFVYLTSERLNTSRNCGVPALSHH